MSRRVWLSGPAVGGFTLIEVIGALVIFSVGVLMVVQVSGALGARMRQAGQRSALAVFASERLDSLEAVPFASLVPGTTADTFRVEGVDFEARATVTAITEVLKRIDVAVQPLAGPGPSYTVTSYTSAVW